MKDFWEAHWDKISLMLIFVFLVCVDIHLIHNGDDAARDWGQNLASQVLSGILGYSAGKAVGQLGQLPQLPQTLQPPNGTKEPNKES
jgi:hypothetical protein